MPRHSIMQKKHILRWIILTHILVGIFHAATLVESISTTTIDSDDSEGHPNESHDATPYDESEHKIPKDFSSPLGSYPNSLDIDDTDRSYFHPVILPPTGMVVPVMDWAQATGLATPEEIAHARRKRRNLIQIFIGWFRRRFPNLCRGKGKSFWSVGKYDENRVSMYTSELFQNLDHSIDGYRGARTVHLGIDLGGPVGTPIYAFAEGTVYAAGYNPEFGDYGYVVVVEHLWNNRTQPVWALYGHLDKGSIKGKRPGTKIRRGQVVGRLGDCHENGGWISPHVHFQLAKNPPETHDMPGASSIDDRPQALIDYPDPRYVLGAVHE